MGSFCLFIAGQDNPKKKLMIISAVPLLDYFDINEEKDNRYYLNIDGVDYLLQSTPLIRERLKNALEVAYAEICIKTGLELHSKYFLLQHLLSC